MQGITFVNQYIIVGTLGQGAFGKVKLVLNTADMNLYAVKLLSKGSLLRHQRMRPRTANDFQQEAQRRMNVIRLLHHPNIICPFEVIGGLLAGLPCAQLPACLSALASKQKQHTGVHACLQQGDLPVLATPSFTFSVGCSPACYFALLSHS